MACCKCTEFGWSPPVAPHYHAEDGTEYCIFHSPPEQKNSNIEEFTRSLESRIRSYIQRRTFCNLSGSIFTISFDLPALANTKYIATHLSLNDCTFLNSATFNECTFLNQFSCTDANFESDVSFHKSIFLEDATFLNTNASMEISFVKARFEKKVDFTNFGFQGPANFSGTVFVGTSDFIRSVFLSEALFSYSRFTTEGYFNHSIFNSNTKFDNSTFDSIASFQSIEFGGTTAFNNSIFKGETSFDTSTFKKNTTFNNSTFKGETSLKNIHFMDDIYFNSATFKDESSFQGVNFANKADFEWCTFLGTTSFIDAHFSAPCTFRNATFKSTSKFFNCIFDNNAIFQDLHSVSDMRFSILDLNHVDLIGTPLNNIWFQDLFCPRATQEERYKIPQEDTTDNTLRVADFYRQMKRHYKDRQNDTEASLWHFSEKETQLKHYTEKKSSKFLEATLRLYRFSSRYGESPLRAATTLLLLLTSLISCIALGILYKFGNSLIFSWSCVGKFFLTFFQYALLIKPDWEPPALFAILSLIISRLLIPIQATLLGFALRNRFMR